MSISSNVEPPHHTMPQRNWLLRLFLALVVAIFAAIIIPPLMPKSDPVVRTLLRVPQPTPFLVRAGQPLPDISSYQCMQIALVKSRLVLSSALRDPTVTGLPLISHRRDPLPWLEKEVQADFTLAPEILRISMRGQETDDRVVLVNAIREAFKREVVESEIIVRKLRQEIIAKLIQKYEEQLKAAREILEPDAEWLVLRNDTIWERMITLIQQQLRRAEKELLDTQSELRKVRTTLFELKVQEKTLDRLPIPEAAVAEQLAKDQTVVAIKAEIEDLNST
jgi:hypothetical protein